MTLCPLEVCTNKKKYSTRDEKWREGMENSVTFIETSHRECHLYKSSATVNLQTDVSLIIKKQFKYLVEVVETQQSHLLSHQFVNFMY